MNLTIDGLQRSAQAELRRIGAYVKGAVGVAAQHMESGQMLSVDHLDRYPLASSVKMAIALRLLDLMDRGEVRLDQMVDVGHAEMNSYGPIGDEFFYPGVALSVMNLLEPMITRSCNTATDVLFRVCGGAPAVQAHLRRIGIDDFEVTRTMREALCVLHEIPLPPPDVSERDIMRHQPFEVLDARNRTNAEFHHEQRDHATPAAMLMLLRKLWQADGVSAEARRVLLDVMSRTSTSVDRVQARLPRGVPFASKGGSGAGTAVDVGYLTLPEGRGTVALAIFIKGSPLDMASRNRTIADLARLVYDWFVLVAEPAQSSSNA
ncbi:MAG: serine hydrolase [Rubrivivax sp.]